MKRRKVTFHGAMDNIQSLTITAAVEDYPHWNSFKSICDIVCFVSSRLLTFSREEVLEDSQ